MKTAETIVWYVSIVFLLGTVALFIHTFSLNSSISDKALAVVMLITGGLNMITANMHRKRNR